MERWILTSSCGGQTTILHFTHLIADRLKVTSPAATLSILFAELHGVNSLAISSAPSADFCSMSPIPGPDLRAPLICVDSAQVQLPLVPQETITLSQVSRGPVILPVEPKTSLSLASTDSLNLLPSSSSAQLSTVDSFIRSYAPSPCSSPQLKPIDFPTPSASFDTTADSTPRPTFNGSSSSTTSADGLPLFLPGNTPIIDWRPQWQSSHSLMSLILDSSESIGTRLHISDQGSDFGHGETDDEDTPSKHSSPPPRGLGNFSCPAFEGTPTLATLLDYPQDSYHGDESIAAPIPAEHVPLRPSRAESISLETPTLDALLDHSDVSSRRADASYTSTEFFGLRGATNPFPQEVSHSPREPQQPMPSSMNLSAATPVTSPQSALLVSTALPMPEPIIREIHRATISPVSSPVRSEHYVFESWEVPAVPSSGPHAPLKRKVHSISPSESGSSVSSNASACSVSGQPVSRHLFHHWIYQDVQLIPRYLA